MSTADAHDAPARDLLVAHRQYLDAAVDVLRHVPPKFVRPAPLVLLALGMRLVERGCAAHTLCVQGYARDVGPVLRSMLSAVASITYIAKANADSRALAFLDDEVRIARNIIPRIRDQELFTPDEADRLLRQTETFNSGRVKAFAAEGISADKEGRTGRSWHGYATDEQFFDAIGLRPWYDAFYSRLSEDSHGSSWSLFSEMQSLARGDYTFGPHYGNTVDLRYAIASSYTIVNGCLVQIDAAVALDQTAAVARAAEAMRAAMRTAHPQAAASPPA
jgi:hypothetical protein